MNLLEWKLHSSSLPEDFTENYKKLIEHLKTMFNCNVVRLAPQDLEVNLAFGYNRQLLKIHYNDNLKYFIIHISDTKTSQILLDIAHVTWDDTLLTLQKKGYIKDTKLCEQISTIDEFKLYKNLWSNSLLEWKDSKGNTVKLNNTSNQAVSKTSNNTSEKVVYAWDMYLDPNDKGTFCSAEQYNGVWDGMVYETDIDADNAAWYHLQELETEGELSPDPNIYVEPDDYTIDIFTIPLSEVSDAVLQYSNLEHLR